MNEKTLQRALTEHCKRMAAARWNATECTCGRIKGRRWKDGSRNHAPDCPRAGKRKESK